MATVRDEVIGIVRRRMYLKVNPEYQIKPEDPLLEHLGADDVAVQEIFWDVEELYKSHDLDLNKAFPFNTFESMKIADIIEHVEANIK